MKNKLGITLEKKQPFIENYFSFSAITPLKGDGYLLTCKVSYSEKATQFCEISTNYLSYVLPENNRWRFRTIVWPSQNI